MMPYDEVKENGYSLRGDNPYKKNEIIFGKISNKDNKEAFNKRGFNQPLTESQLIIQRNKVVEAYINGLDNQGDPNDEDDNEDDEEEDAFALAEKRRREQKMDKQQQYNTIASKKNNSCNIYQHQPSFQYVNHYNSNKASKYNQSHTNPLKTLAHITNHYNSNPHKPLYKNKHISASARAGTGKGGVESDLSINSMKATEATGYNSSNPNNKKWIVYRNTPSYLHLKEREQNNKKVNEPQNLKMVNKKRNNTAKNINKLNLGKDNSSNNDESSHRICNAILKAKSKIQNTFRLEKKMNDKRKEMLDMINTPNNPYSINWTNKLLNKNNMEMRTNGFINGVPVMKINRKKDNYPTISKRELKENLNRLKARHNNSTENVNERLEKKYDTNRNKIRKDLQILRPDMREAEEDDYNPNNNSIENPNSRHSSITQIEYPLIYQFFHAHHYS